MEKLLTLRELCRNVQAYSGQTIKIGGWVRNRRASKSFGFIMLSDGTYFQPVQIVITDGMENFAEIAKVNKGMRYYNATPEMVAAYATMELQPDL